MSTGAGVVTLVPKGQEVEVVDEDGDGFINSSEFAKVILEQGSASKRSTPRGANPMAAEFASALAK